MLNRCTNQNTPGWKNYGGRGITVCERWRSYESFRDDMGHPPSDLLSIDRINNSKGYEPGNCRWATRSQQANNKRNNVIVTFNGTQMTLIQAAAAAGLPYKLVHTRINSHGWSPERALTTSQKRRA